MTLAGSLADLGLKALPKVLGLHDSADFGADDSPALNIALAPPIATLYALWLPGACDPPGE